MANLIDLEEEFPHLPQAPIVEAVLDIRVVLSVTWDEDNLRNKLEQLLPDYPKRDTMQETEIQFSPHEGTNLIRNSVHVGLKCQSEDGFNVIQFNKNSFVFSRLNPYENWERFSQEALRLWEIYCELLKPTEIGRIGLRFINRLAIRNQRAIELADYYKNPPESIKGLNWPLAGYLHQDRIQVSDTSYFVNVIKTTQNTQMDIGLLLDIDVYMDRHLGFDELRVSEHINKMRWIKNKVFFNSLTEKALKECR